MPLAFDAQLVGDCRYGFAETPFLGHEWSGGDLMLMLPRLLSVVIAWEGFLPFSEWNYGSLRLIAPFYRSAKSLCQ